jgi:hypothetical protein
VHQLLEWTEKANRAVKIAEVELDAAARRACQQDLRLFRAKRKFQEAQERFEKIAKVANEISETRKLKAK